MTDELAELTDVVRRLARPLHPEPTDVAPRLEPLSGIRCVLFDIYGTLLISGSGDVGAAAETGREQALLDAMHACGGRWSQPPEALDEQLRDEISRRHEIQRTAGVDYPEVDICDVWRTLLSRWIDGGLALSKDISTRRFALEHEMRANPVWTMPGAVETLRRLTDGERPGGIVSNAQFYTPLICETLWNARLSDLGLAPDLQHYSHRYGRAKPSDLFFEKAVESLAARSLAPAEVLYIGNDMLNDVTAAARAGMRTAWFAGDQRSLRRRTNDPRVAGVVPDVIVTELSQLIDCCDVD